MSRAAAIALAAAVVVLGSGCGGGEDTRRGGLAWEGKPYVGTPSEMLPDDHVVLGRIRNAGFERIKAHYEEVRLLEADGDAVPAGIRFTNASGHGLYPPDREPASVRASEDERIGRSIDLEPGESAPIVVAWRGDAKPVTIDLGAGRLELPR